MFSTSEIMFYTIVISRVVDLHAVETLKILCLFAAKNVDILQNHSLNMLKIFS